jgi:hypothetical protein
MIACSVAAHQLHKLEPDIAATILDALRFLKFGNRATTLTVETPEGPYRCLMARDRRNGQAVLVNVTRSRKATS